MTSLSTQNYTTNTHLHFDTNWCYSLHTRYFTDNSFNADSLFYMPILKKKISSQISHFSLYNSTLTGRNHKMYCMYHVFFFPIKWKRKSTCKFQSIQRNLSINQPNQYNGNDMYIMQIEEQRKWKKHSLRSFRATLKNEYSFILCVFYSRSCKKKKIKSKRRKQ